LTSQKLLESAIGPLSTQNDAFANIVGFGLKHEDTDIGGPPLWYKPALSATTNPQTQNHQAKYGEFPGCQICFAQHHVRQFLKLSLQELDCGYTLKYVELNRRPKPDRPWSERQSCIIHTGSRQEWVLISPSTRMQICMDKYCKSLDSGHDYQSFVLHLMFIGAAMSNWRPYLAYLTKETKDQVNSWSFLIQLLPTDTP
jgi:hypothetical protein